MYVCIFLVVTLFLALPTKLSTHSTLLAHLILLDWIMMILITQHIS
jgi:hypothetical protein